MFIVRGDPPGFCLTSTLPSVDGQKNQKEAEALQSQAPEFARTDVGTSTPDSSCQILRGYVLQKAKISCEALRNRCGSKINQGDRSPLVHLPGFHFGVAAGLAVKKKKRQAVWLAECSAPPPRWCRTADTKTRCPPKGEAPKEDTLTCLFLGPSPCFPLPPIKRCVEQTLCAIAKAKSPICFYE